MIFEFFSVFSEGVENKRKQTVFSALNCLCFYLYYSHCKGYIMIFFSGSWNGMQPIQALNSELVIAWMEIFWKGSENVKEMASSRE